MNESIEYDEKWGKRLIQIYSTPDVVKQREIILSKLNFKPGEKVIDIGSGPGLLAEDIAKEIGESGLICGVDISDAMISLSKNRCSQYPQIELRKGDATSLPYNDNEFDAAVSTQVYEYIEDIQTCLNELYRVLKNGGRALILCTDWDTLIWNTDDQDRMQRILSAFEAHCADPRLPRTIANRILNTGFSIVEQDVYTVLNPKYDANTYCYGVIDFIVSYVAEKNEEMAKEAKAWAEEMRKKGKANSFFCSINRYIFLLAKPIH